MLGFYFWGLLLIIGFYWFVAWLAGTHPYLYRWWRRCCHWLGTNTASDEECHEHRLKDHHHLWL